MPRRSPDDFQVPRLVEPVTIELPAPPDHLSPQMQQWWRQVVADYDLESHHLRLLELAADSWDRVVEARETVRRDGMTVQGTHGPRPHPCLGVERDNKVLFSRLVRELDLDEPVPSPARYMPPPALRSNRRR